MLWKTYLIDVVILTVGDILPKRSGFIHGFVRRSLNSTKSTYFMCKAAGSELLPVFYLSLVPYLSALGHSSAGRFFYLRIGVDVGDEVFRRSFERNLDPDQAHCGGRGFNQSGAAQLFCGQVFVAQRV